jgi:hypothetical protein
MNPFWSQRPLQRPSRSLCAIFLACQFRLLDDAHGAWYSCRIVDCCFEPISDREVRSMRQWLSRFATLFLIALGPSVVGWGLLVRWSAGGPSRFVRVWSWLADRLAFPLLLAPATDPAKRWLIDGSGLQSAAGFAILITLWCAMLALPLSLLLVWARWLGGRLAPSSSFAGGYDPYLDLPLALPASPARNVLYLVTIPLALLWHAARIALPGALKAFLIVWAIRFGYLTLSITWEDWRGFSRRLTALEAERRGRFGVIGATSLFAHPWARYLKASAALAREFNASPITYRHYQGQIFHYHVVLKLFAMDAALYGLAAAAIVAAIVGARQLRRLAAS